MSNKDEVALELQSLASQKLMDMLQDSTKKLHEFVDTEIRKQFAKTFSLDEERIAVFKNIEMTMTSASAALNNENQTTNKNPVNETSLGEAAKEMIKIRNYLLGPQPTSEVGRSKAKKKLPKPKEKEGAVQAQGRISEEMIQRVIITAIHTRNLTLIRLVLKEDTKILDFRALDSSWIEETSGPQKPPGVSELLKSVCAETDIIVEMPLIPQLLETPITLTKLVENLPQVNFDGHCIPPNEFDWFSRDRLGAILTMKEAYELFSIMELAKCSGNVEELYLNARRLSYMSLECASEQISSISNVLEKMGRLTTLVLRGMCDDHMLKVVGQTAKGLKYLDVSGSQFVTDNGIKNLFFGDVKENPATYLVKAYIEKTLQLGQMNKLVGTLEFLDYSWTNVTTLARKMVLHIPGAYIFKRVYAQGEDDGFGHHVFIRRKEAFKGKIPLTIDRDLERFESKLGKVIGEKALKKFLKITDIHPWRNCIISVFSNSTSSVEKDPDTKFYGIITPNEEERRVHGVIVFQDGHVTESYSVFPFNLNILGETCPKLQTFRGIATDIWKLKSSLLHDLTEIDMFADPLTTKSILESVPNLKKVRVRIVRQPLTDEHIIKPMTTFMCCRTLEELWIEPGTYRKSGPRSEEPEPTNKKSILSNQAIHFSINNPPGLRSSIMIIPPNPPPQPTPPVPAPAVEPVEVDSISTIVAPPETMSTVSASESSSVTSDDLRNSNSTPDVAHIDNLVHLSENCLRVIVGSCLKLKRIGDVASWTGMSEEKFKIVCGELKAWGSDVVVVWENGLFPNVNKFFEV